MSFKLSKEKLNVTLESTLKELKQQRLAAWKPVFTSGTVLPTFFLLGIALVVIGIALFLISSKAQEFEFDYTDCWPLFGFKSCAQTLDDNPYHSGCKCWFKFELEEDFSSSVYVYYGLKNYFQNHRLYENSVDDSQLMGAIQASSSCEPFQYKTTHSGKTLPIVPCGTIANSLFNDSFNLWHHNLTSNLAEVVPLLFTSISWPSDQYWYNNPKGVPLEVAFANFTNPPYWRKQIWQLDPKNPDNNGLKNEALIVWFRTAAFPEFRKLYARVNHKINSIFENTLPKGHYFLEIDYNYPVTSFEGRKSVIIGNTTWMGGKNIFLGIAYIVCGLIILIMTIVLLFIHMKYGMRKMERIAITEKTPYFSHKRPRLQNIKQNFKLKFIKTRQMNNFDINQRF